jgi:hypothetical protein
MSDEFIIQMLVIEFVFIVLIYLKFINIVQIKQTWEFIPQNIPNTLK